MYFHKEHKLVPKQMHPWKSPGPDGLHAVFYQNYWQIVSMEVSQMALSFLNGNCSFENINHTNIALIPKVKRPTHIT